jgi:hypothetical protein
MLRSKVVLYEFSLENDLSGEATVREMVKNNLIANATSKTGQNGGVVQIQQFCNIFN